MCDHENSEVIMSFHHADQFICTLPDKNTYQGYGFERFGDSTSIRMCIKCGQVTDEGFLDRLRTFSDTQVWKNEAESLLGKILSWGRNEDEEDEEYWSDENVDRMADAFVKKTSFAPVYRERVYPHLSELELATVQNVEAAIIDKEDVEDDEVFALMEIVKRLESSG